MMFPSELEVITRVDQGLLGSVVNIDGERTWLRNLHKRTIRKTSALSYL